MGIYPLGNIIAVITHSFFQTTFVRPSELRLNPYYIQVYLIWMKIVFVELIPYVVILVSNIWMGIE